MTDSNTNEASQNITFNHIHKRLMVLYNLNDMRNVWKKVRSDWKKDKKTILPKRFKKYPQTWIDLNVWVEEKINNFILNGGIDIQYLNKADLKLQGWDEKIIKILYPNPDKVVYLGRGRYAYYYNGAKVSEFVDSDEFIEYIALKLDRKRKREENKNKKSNPMGYKFGSEFIR